MAWDPTRCCLLDDPLPRHPPAGGPAQEQRLAPPSRQPVSTGPVAVAAGVALAGPRGDFPFLGRSGARPPAAGAIRLGVLAGRLREPWLRPPRLAFPGWAHILRG